MKFELIRFDFNREALDKLMEDVEYVKDFNASIQRITNKNLEDITNLHKEIRYYCVRWLY